MNPSVCVFTFINANNYGAVLQAYALKRWLEEEGYKVVHYDYRPKKSVKGLKSYIRELIISRTFSRFRRRHFELVANTGCEYYARIYGSDQVWNLDIVKDDIDIFLGSELAGTKIGYACSFGSKPQHDLLNIIEKISAFRAVSVRERSALEFLLEKSNVPVVEVLDPVFLLHNYDELVKPKYFMEGVCCYLFNERNRDLGVISRFSSVYGGHFHLNVTRVSDGRAVPFPSVESWLSKVAGSHFVLTDSFHCMVLSIIYRKPFYVLPARMDRFDRILGLLEKLGLEDRILYDIKDLDFVENREIEYGVVHDLIAENLKLSEDFLKGALNVP